MAFRFKGDFPLNRFLQIQISFNSVIWNYPRNISLFRLSVRGENSTNPPNIFSEWKINCLTKGTVCTLCCYKISPPINIFVSMKDSFACQSFKLSLSFSCSFSPCGVVYGYADVQRNSKSFNSRKKKRACLLFSIFEKRQYICSLQGNSRLSLSCKFFLDGLWKDLK